MTVRRPLCAMVALLLSAALSLSGCGIILLGDGVPDDTRAPDDGETSRVESVTTDDGASSILKMDQTEAYQALSDAYLERISETGYTFDGESFFIATPRTELLESDASADIYSAAIYRRNQRVEDALHIRLSASLTDETAYLDLLSASILADEYFADLLLIPESGIGSFAVGDVLMNLRSVPLLDLTEPYFFAGSVSAATAGNVIYAVAGEASFEPTSLSAVFFNCDLFRENGVEIPYERVYDGTWTWDAFFASCAAVEGINAYAEAHGIGRFSSYATQYAAELLPMMVYATGGTQTVASPPGSTPTVSISAEDGDVLDVIVRLYDEPNAYANDANGVSRFYSGKSLYLIDRLYLTSWMPDSAQNWGILPLPKVYEEQEGYISLAADDALFFAVPKNTVDAARVAVVLSALNAASYGVLRESYVNYAMNTLLRDNDSANMLDIICASPAYDFALAFAHTVPSLSEATTLGLAGLGDGLSRSALLNRASAANRQLATRFSVSNP